MRGPENEPIFCMKSQAPMPMCLASESSNGPRRSSASSRSTPSQRTRHTSRLQVEGHEGVVNVFQQLEDIIQELSGNKREDDDVKYQIAGRSWMDLKTGFSKIQKALQQDIKDGNASSKMRGVVMDLEEGKKFIEYLLQEKYDVNDFMRYIDRAVQSRWVHYRYLEETASRNNQILKSRESYLNNLKETLQEVCKASMDCACPSRITMAAAQRSEKIAILRLRRIKQRIRKTKPTPGQKVLDLMGNDEDRDKTKLQELKESVIPTQTFSVGQLESKGVVVRMHEKLAPKTRKHLNFTFSMTGEGFNVQVFLKTTLLKEFGISRQQMEDLEVPSPATATSRNIETGADER
ncbi:unnamed protein product [Effrenium voratum]|uniref:Uncharacterized protein n=1 Tax=Effrenium voratum TaxID=2562239 RepID=A0AA36JL63_9DINO|nr:unnamed protein product [Effrenium voratum]